tara:strand:+ start:1047 stop:1385 length:339 start_codon:yes stop_codon:yes gene_type:complete
MENKQFADMSYAKKNKDLCVYCSYREAVPSKNKLFCSELCRLLHFSVNDEKINIQEISKLIKLNKIDLIQMILNLKSQEIEKDKLCEIFDKKIKEKAFAVKKEKKEINLDFS